MGEDARAARDPGDVLERSRAASASAPAWTRVHSSEDLRSVSSARVRFTSLDVTRTRLVLGANTGSAYVFARARDRVDGREARGRLLAVISPESGERNGSGTRTRAAAQSVRCVRASPCGRMCALGFADGCVRVIELETEGTGEDGRRRNGAGELVGHLTTTHEGRSITALSWSRDSKTLYAGSDRGRVTLLSCAAFVRWCEGGYAGARPAVVNKTEYADAGSAVHDIDASTSGRHIVVSAQSSAQLIVVDGDASGTATNIGSKQREGAYGGCFHEYANLSIGDEAIDEDVIADENWDSEEAALVIAEYAVLARPARKLWIAKVKGMDANVEVLATIKPEVPDPSFAPGWDGKKESADFLKRMSKKLEFGIVQRFGPCILSTTERAVSIIDIVTPTISRWYPLKEPGSELISAGFVDVRVCEHRAFFLTPSEEGGSSVWCLESFESSTDVARDVAKDFASVSATIQALEICQKTMSFDEDLFTRAKAVLSDCKDDDARSRLEFLIRWGEDTGSKLPQPIKPADLRRVAIDESLTSPKPAKPNEPSKVESGKPPLGRERATSEASSGSATVAVSDEFPKAESDGGIFFYNPRGVSKSTMSNDADPQKKLVNVVKKRHAQILDDIEENVPTVSVIRPREVKVSMSSNKDYGTDWPTNDDEWEQCDMYDFQKWKEAIEDAQKSFAVEGERFDHWSSYTANANANALDGHFHFQGGNARAEYRSAMKVRVEMVVDCANALRESHTSLDAAPLVRSLRSWRETRKAMGTLFARYNQDEHKSLTEKMNALIEEVLGSAEKLLDSLCEELQLDTAVMKESAQRIEPMPTVDHDAHVSMQLESLKSTLMAQGPVEEVNRTMESECISALRRCESAEAMAIVKESLRRALLNLVESVDSKSGTMAEVEARLKLIARVGSAALGPAEVVRALCEASEDDALSRAMTSTEVAEATALSDVLTAITSFLTSENAIDLDMRRDAANLLKPLHQHLSRPPMRAFGRFTQLQAALNAELDGELDSLPFIESCSNHDDGVLPWRLKAPHEAPISASIGDFGDWGVKMDLSECPACRHSLLLAQGEPLVTFMCSHTYHKSCIVDYAACFACCCDV